MAGQRVIIIDFMYWTSLVNKYVNLHRRNLKYNLMALIAERTSNDPVALLQHS